MDKAFVGRQPIFTPAQEVYGYELLFRSSETSAADFRDGDHATATVLMSAFTDIGLQTLVNDKRAFINTTRNLLVDGTLSCLPQDRMVLEVLEDVDPEPEILHALRELRETGYTIALDDFVYRPELEPLVELADLIKIEFPAIANEDLAEHVSRLREHGVKTILAEKVETQEDFELCRDIGCDLFQGYFFSKPQVISRGKMQSNVAAVIRLVSELQDPNITPTDVEAIIQMDANLSYRLLRFVNSAAAGTTCKIGSLRQATALMGIHRLRSLASMLILTGLDEKKPKELINLAMTRAKTCELLANSSDSAHPERFYTVGLFSVLDAMLDQPMEDVLESLPLETEINDALLDQSGPMGEILRSVLNYETGTASQSTIGFTTVADAYQQSLRWLSESGQTL
ncbi:EAL and HDOD domain-containing protein [Roseiconus lacunae]|uniref:EAL and HDOD domain-containing protein n=1 Tax=Roseiconus lacunae TaxID=2605694 RepID=UPI001E5A5FD9|nr:HDOD domain-containing protein [Roseiconus lacunae]MCD0458114.1 HDOD domain-containing protein [Roseiconus lacunae]